MTRRGWIALVAALIVAVSWWFAPEPAVEEAGVARVSAAFEEGRSGVVVELAGEVTRVLSDDLEGSRHQRFIVRLVNEQTVLVSHNIDLAERIPLRVSDRIELRGQYEWNDRGGVIHWTHHDPDGRRPGGWVRHRGRTYR